MSQTQLISGVRAAFGSGKTRSVSFRRSQLKNLLRMYEERNDEILEALHKDLSKPKQEASLELEMLKGDVRHILRNLDEWTKPKKLPLNALMATDSAFIQKEPFGVALILGTWNYPFAMALEPLAGAIAAGNCAVIKPSEVSAHSSATIARIVPQYLDNECYKVFEGDVAETVELLNHQFDYIFATGSCTVGKSVMAAAAKHLTPVTLELGGKSPVYIDDTADIQKTAKRLMWGKLLNAGQTCIAPDYILVSKKRQVELLDAVEKTLVEWYGKDCKQSKDLTRIINVRHFNRLKKVLESTNGRIAVGGQTDEKELWIAPTLIVDLDPKTDVIMQDEIFGPLLPVVNVESPEEALKFILERPKPLALYVFSDDQGTVNKFLKKSSSGAMCINDCLLQITTEGLPFGGVGNSGMGRYHGQYSIDTFSHHKSVLVRSLSMLGEKLADFRYPPYSNSKINFYSRINRILHRFELTSNSYLTHGATLALGLGIATAYFMIV